MLLDQIFRRIENGLLGSGSEQLFKTMLKANLEEINVITPIAGRAQKVKQPIQRKEKNSVVSYVTQFENSFLRNAILLICVNGRCQNMLKISRPSYL